MKKFVVAVAVTLAIAIIIPAVNYARFKFGPHQRLYGKARKEWKQAAISELARKATDSTWLSNELAIVAARMKSTASGTDGDWFTGNLVLTRSGEWMLCTNICSKSDRRIHDLFLGRGSNGKWYYSTYHFCIQMIVLRMDVELDGQPENLERFAWAYYLREFDGQSDRCLEETWNPRLRRLREPTDGPNGP